jgi:hypothetical protein
VNLRPLGIGELLDASMKVCIANWRTLLKIVLFVVVPVQIISAVVIASTLPEDFADPFSFETDDDDLRRQRGGHGVRGPRRDRGPLGDHVPAGHRAPASARSPDLAGAGARLARVAALRAAPLARAPVGGFAYSVAVLFFFVLLIIPASGRRWPSRSCSPIVMVERIGGFRALRRSFRLVRGRLVGDVRRPARRGSRSRRSSRRSCSTR